MQVLLLSIMAKSGVFTHVRDLSVSLRKAGVKPILGLINSEKAKKAFKIQEKDFVQMEKMLQGMNIPYFLYENENDLKQQIIGKQLEIVHAHSPMVMSTAGRIANELNIPYVITLHGVLAWNKLYPRNMKKATKIIAIGPEVAKSAGESNQHKTTIIYNGVDLERFYPAGDFECRENPLRILWLGRTRGAAAQGAECLTRAIRLLQQQGLQLETKALGFAGDAKIEVMKTYGWVFDPVPYLQWGHLVFARGRALREAMACGSAGFLLAEGYGGRVREDWFGNGRMPQLSGTNKHGAQKLNVFQIADDILYFYQHREELAEARKEARRIAECYFDVRFMAERTCQVYAEALKSFK
ncbi:MAG TPA: hypothetical protein DCE00_03140 [Firmicutes bacterium]|nr:hypothetical protein [Bacillota bacterium]